MCEGATRPSTQTCIYDVNIRAAMINPVSQLQCTCRAEWRLQTGRPAKPLSPNYRLDCDFGTAVIILWKEGGGEPIYVCDTHAKQLGRSRDHCPDAYIITAPSEQSDNPTKREDRTQNERGANIKSDGSASLAVGRSLADTKVGRAMINRPSGRDLTYGSAAKAMVDEAIWNMATGDYQVYRTALQQGKSPSEAAETAGGQLAVIHRKINEYTLKLEAILSKSQTTISVEEFIDKPLEQAVLDISMIGQ